MKLLEACDALGITLPRLRRVSLGSEYTSRLQYAYLRAKLPAASFSFRGGAAEIGISRYYKCPALEDSPEAFHLLHHTHLSEILDPVSGAPCALGQEGEITHTDLTRKAVPLIRYRTGDVGFMERKKCACGEDLVLHLKGRLGLDNYRYGGILFSVEMIAEALRKAPPPGLALKPDFRLHIYEVSPEGKPKPRLELHLSPVLNAAKPFLPPELAERLAASIAAHLSLSASATLADMLRDGRIHSFEVKLAESLEDEGPKARKIIAHL